MLAQKTYPTALIDAGRTAITTRLTAYRAVAATAPDAARHAFESLYCRDLIVLLDSWFMHRTRGVEGKDGNPANEVRMLAAGIIHDNAVLATDPTIRYRADRSITGLDIGDTINLTIDQAERLATAYFDTIAERFAEP